MYGLGTRSYNRSTEARQMKRECAEARKKVESGEIQIPAATVGPMCTCISFRFAHLPEDHKKLKSDMDWRTYEQRMTDGNRVTYWQPTIR